MAIARRYNNVVTEMRMTLRVVKTVDEHPGRRRQRPMNRREFLEVLAAGAAAGLALDTPPALAQADDAALYPIPRFGNASLPHFTDCHAQLLPVHFREPDVNIGVGAAAGRPPHLVGEDLLKAYGIAPGRAGSRFTHLDFARPRASTGSSAASRISRRW